MFTMVMNFPSIKTKTAARPRSCPHCDSSILQRWGRISKSLLDPHLKELEIHRYRCTNCGRTFRSYPPGVDRVNRSRRIRTLAAITWSLGLTLDEVVKLFQNMGVELSRTTIWRDGQALDPYYRLHNACRAINILGEDESPDQTKIDKDEITLILELGQVKLALGIVDEEGPYSTRSWLESLAAEAGLELTVSPRSSRLLN